MTSPVSSMPSLVSKQSSKLTNTITSSGSKITGKLNNSVEFLKKPSNDKKEEPVAPKKPAPRKPVPAKKDKKEFLVTPQYDKDLAKDFPWKKIGMFVDPEDTHSAENLKNLTPQASDSMVKHYIMDKYYSDIYWNCSLMIGTCIFAWFSAKCGGGFLSLVFVLICSATAYGTEFRRFNTNLRDDMARASAVRSIEGKPETIEWLNSFLAKFWVIYMPAMSEMVLTIANANLEVVPAPPPIDKLTLDEFTLGTKAPRVESIKSLVKLGTDSYEMIFDFGFTPNDTDDMTKNEIKKKIDPKVALGIRVGKGFVGVTAPVLVEDMSISGSMKITLELSQNFPHIKVVSLSFINPPDISYALKPVGGNTFGIDIMSLIPGLSSFVNNMIHSNIGPMFYAPNSFDINVEELLEGWAATAVGVLAVTVKHAETAREFENCYVSYCAENNTVSTFKTNMKETTKNPVFNETKYLLVTSLDQKLKFGYHSFNDKEHKLIGESFFKLSDLEQGATRTNVSSKILDGSKRIGNLVYDLRWFPVLQGETQEDGTTLPPPDSDVGILKLVLHSGQQFDDSKSMIGKLSTYAEVYLDDKFISKSRLIKGSSEPTYNLSLERLVTSKATSVLTVLIKDTSSYDITTIAKFSAPLQDVILRVSDQSDMFQSSPQGKIRLTTVWKPVSLSDDIVGPTFVPPIGTARLHIRKCENIKDMDLLSTANPYVKVTLSGRERFRTAVKKETQNPYYDEIVYLPVTSESQKLTIDVLDFKKASSNKILGSTTIQLGKYMKSDKEGRYNIYEGSTEIRSKDITYKGKDVRGKLFYSISFYPSLPVYSHKELEEIKEKESKRELALKEQEEEQEELLEEYKKNKKDYEWVDIDELEKENINPDLVASQQKIKLATDELSKYDSGVLGINIIGGKLIRPNCYIHILFDDASWPSFVSSEVIRKKVTTDSGEGFVRNLKNSTMTVRLVRKKILESKNDLMDEKTFKVSDILTKGHEEPVTIELNGNRIKFLFDYIPNSSHLSPSESMNDTGIMELNFKSGSGLMAADRNGKSDPFVLLFLNGVEIFKSSVAKKTLDPVWNENITFPIRSLSRGEVKVVVYDWDRAASNDLLGEAILDLSSVKPNGAVQMNVPLDTQGSIQVDVKFQPQYVRPGIDEAFSMSDTLNLVSKAPLKLVSGAADIGGAVGGTVGGAALNTLSTGTSGAANVASSVGSGLAKGLRFGSKKKSVDISRENGSSSSSKETSHHHSLLHRESFQSELRPPSGNYSSDVQSSRTGGGLSVPSSPMANKRQPQHSPRTSMDVSSFMSSSMDGNSIPGRVKVEYLEGVDKKVGFNCKVSLISPNKNKEIYKSRSVKPASGTVKWNESTAFKAPATATMQFSVKEHHTFGKSNDFAEGSILLADIAGKNDDVPITLSNGAILYVNFNYHTQ